MRQFVHVFLFSFAVSLSEAFAVDASSPQAAPAGTVESATSESFLSKFSASHTIWLTGPRVKALDGVEDKGHELKFRQFPTLTYALTETTELSATQYFTTWARSTAPGGRDFIFNDPYITLGFDPLWKNTSGAKLEGYLRYYIPASHDAADNVGKRRDNKNGLARVKIDPSQEFFDGFVTANATIYVYRAFAGAAPDAQTPSQRLWAFWFNPRLTFMATHNFFPFVGYLNIIERSRVNPRYGQSKWSRFTDQHQLELGFNWMPHRKLMVSPYIEYGGDKWTLRDSALGVIVDWALL